MIEYCVGDCGCRRAYLLKFFGEKVGKGICGKTCDFCKNPDKVESEIRAALSAGGYSHTTTSKKPPSFTLADDQTRPPGDYGDDDFDTDDEVRPSEERSDEIAKPFLVTKTTCVRTSVHPPPSVTTSTILTYHSKPILRFASLIAAFCKPGR